MKTLQYLPDKMISVAVISHETVHWRPLMFVFDSWFYNYKHLTLIRYSKLRKSVIPKIIEYINEYSDFATKWAMKSI